MSQVICLMGPTASGKTAVACQLSQQLACDIISVDSAMVYRHLDIGSAKPNADELKQAPHRLINLREPNEPYSAADFCRDANSEIAATLQAKRVPLLVGGTMLYFKALQQGLSPLPAADPVLRAKISAEAAKLGWPALHQQLEQIDPTAAARIHANDPQRLRRALEVYQISGKTLTELQQRVTAPAAWKFINIVLFPADREVLRRVIAKRFQQMLVAGLVDEVRALYERSDIHAELPALRAVGYRQVWDYLAGRLGYEQMVDRAIIATCQLAKRQMTWLRRWPGAIYFNSQAADVAQQVGDYLHQQC
ncbi:MAG: tRNA (adenosine(37)-N6)-dimethylallyltransferase MiaA [Gammaproteobacteria bacterium]|nr:tRNA (adenosine(37)-N6)-dimethylallyltransferase MiaA [Gammaproteobacteria bacterium]